MATLDDAIKGVVDAVTALEAAQSAEAPAVDPLRTVVETQLESEGWTAPVPATTPADPTTDPTVAEG